MAINVIFPCNENYHLIGSKAYASAKNFGELCSLYGFKIMLE